MTLMTFNEDKSYYAHKNRTVINSNTLYDALVQHEREGFLQIEPMLVLRYNNTFYFQDGERLSSCNAKILCFINK